MIGMCRSHDEGVVTRSGCGPLPRVVLCSVVREAPSSAVSFSWRRAPREVRTSLLLTAALSLSPSNSCKRGGPELPAGTTCVNTTYCTHAYSGNPSRWHLDLNHLIYFIIFYS